MGSTTHSERNSVFKSRHRCREPSWCILRCHFDNRPEIKRSRAPRGTLNTARFLHQCASVQQHSEKAAGSPQTQTYQSRPEFCSSRNSSGSGSPYLTPDGIKRRRRANACKRKAHSLPQLANLLLDSGSRGIAPLKFCTLLKFSLSDQTMGLSSCEFWLARTTAILRLSQHPSLDSCSKHSSGALGSKVSRSAIALRGEGSKKNTTV